MSLHELGEFDSYRTGLKSIEFSRTKQHPTIRITGDHESIGQLHKYVWMKGFFDKSDAFMAWPVFTSLGDRPVSAGLTVTLQTQEQWHDLFHMLRAMGLYRALNPLAREVNQELGWKNPQAWRIDSAAILPSTEEGKREYHDYVSKEIELTTELFKQPAIFDYFVGPGLIRRLTEGSIRSDLQTAVRHLERFKEDRSDKALFTLSTDFAKLFRHLGHRTAHAASLLFFGDTRNKDAEIPNMEVINHLTKEAGWRFWASGPEIQGFWHHYAKHTLDKKDLKVA